MKTKLLLLLIVIASIAKQSQAQIITTIAGTGAQGYSGDGGQATNADLYYPAEIAIDAAGNLYIADLGNNRVRKVNLSGIISIVAGDGINGYSGDGGQAIAAELNQVAGVCFDNVGNLYIADQANSRIRMVNTAGVINTFAGNGAFGYGGDGGQATAAELNTAQEIAFDANGNFYIADLFNNRIRIVTAAGIISTIAGTGAAGYGGDGGPATAAALYQPSGIAFDAIGNLYIADSQNNRIRKVNTLGIVTTLAGNGVSGYSGDGGQATAAELNYPAGICLDSAGNLYIGDSGNNLIRKVNTVGIISTIVGNGTAGFSGDGGQATAAELYDPTRLTLDGMGNLYFADCKNNLLRKVSNVGQMGISQVTGINNQVTVYPNPATSSLQVSFIGNSENSTLVMTDMLGNTVKQTTFNTQHTTLNIADVSAGVYFITLTSGTAVTTKKVIVR